MPTPSTSDLPKPKSWDEFEDIIWEIYTRRWQDLHAQRYGRSGQSQSGVDIYGQQLGSRNYVAIQCKRYKDHRLDQRRILAEIEKAENFSSPISEYIIATTESRDVKVQDVVRELNKERSSERKFPIYIVFWEDICSYLAAPSNDDLLEKYYSQWAKIFRNKPYRGRWRNLEVLNFPVLSDSEASRVTFIGYLVRGLRSVFEKNGYTEFVSLISKFTVTNSAPIVVYQIISHKAEFCHSVRKSYQSFLQEIEDIKSAGFSENEEAAFKEDMKLQILRENSLAGWNTPIDLVLSASPVAHKFIFDPDTQCISISRSTKSVWKEEPSTSDLMVVLSTLLNSHIIITQGFERLSRIPKLMQLDSNVMDGKPIDFNDFRINVEDDEEWNYLAIVEED